MSYKHLTFCKVESTTNDIMCISIIMTSCVLLLMICVYLVQPVEVASDEPNNHAVTTRDSSVSAFVKSSSWPSLQNALCQPITRTDDINRVIPYAQDTAIYDKVTTVPCQPAEDQDALYISTNYSSLPNKADETIDINGPFCEGLSGYVDDYSDYGTNQCEEEGIQFLVPNYCKPQSPQSHWLEDSPLVMQDEHSPTITVSVPSSTTTSGKKIIQI